MEKTALVELLKAEMRAEFEREIAEARKIARDELLQELAAKSGLNPATVLAPSVTPSPLEKRRTVADDTDWTKVIAVCTKCNHRGPADPDFGIRVNPNGRALPQSWCRQCRATTNYHKKERVYKVKGRGDRRR